MGYATVSMASLLCLVHESVDNVSVRKQIHGRHIGNPLFIYHHHQWTMVMLCLILLPQLFITIKTMYWCRIHLWFRLMGGLQAKSMTSQRYRAVTRWRICVTIATLWQQQDGGYALLWKRYDNNDVPTFRWRILHLQQYSHRLNFGGGEEFFYIQ